MKLHLPSSLRAAIIACLSLAAPLSHTVATGALVAGALSFTIANQAQAVYTTDALVATGGYQTYLYSATDPLDADGNTVEGTYLGVNNTDLVSDTILLQHTGIAWLRIAPDLEASYDVTLQFDGTADNVVCQWNDAQERHVSYVGLVNNGLNNGLYFGDGATAGSFTFGELSGSGNLYLGTPDATLNGTGAIKYVFENIVNYQGTVSTLLNDGDTANLSDNAIGLGGDVYISNITAKSGITTTISGRYLYSNALSFSGEGTLAIVGTLTMSALAADGETPAQNATLAMSIDGTFTIASLVLEDNLYLSYSGVKDYVDITAITLGENKLVLDSSYITNITDTYDLGLSKTLITDASSFDLTGLSGYTLYADDSDSWYLVKDGTSFDPDAAGGDVTIYDAVTATSLYASFDGASGYTYACTTDGDASTRTSALTVATATWCSIEIDGKNDLEAGLVLEQGAGIKDVTYDAQLTMNSLAVQGDGTSAQASVILFENIGTTYSFDTLTGSGYLAIATDSADVAADTTGETGVVSIATMTNFNGTITTNTLTDSTLLSALTDQQGCGSITISAVQADAGVTTKLEGNVSSKGLSFTGAGNLDITGTLTYSGESLDMAYEGTLTIAKLALSDDLTLNFLGDAALVKTSVTEWVNNGNTIYISADQAVLDLVTDVNGYDLGIASSTENISISSALGEQGFYLDNSGDNWSIYVTYDTIEASATVVDMGTVTSQTSNIKGDDGSYLAYAVYGDVMVETIIVAYENGANFARFAFDDYVSSDLIVTDGSFIQDGAGAAVSNPKMKDLYLANADGSFASDDTRSVNVHMELAGTTDSSSFTFDSLQGSGTLNVTTDTASMQDHFMVTLKEIKNFNGTITAYSAENLNAGSLTIGSVDVAAGASVTINGTAVYSSDFSFTGGGTLAITGELHYTGDTMTMPTEGTLTIETLVLTSNLTMVYTGDSTATINTITSAETSGVITLDISGAEVGEGIDLGISSAYAGLFNAIEGYEIDASGDTLVLIVEPLTWSSGDITLADGLTGFSGDDGVFNDGDSLRLASAGTLTVASTVNVDTLTIQAAASTDTVTASISGSLTVNSLNINEGVFSLKETGDTVTFTTINIEDGGQLYYQHGPDDMSTTTINLNGGSIFVFDSDGPADKMISLAALNVAEDSTIDCQWKGGFDVAELTGSADLNIYAAVSNDGGWEMHFDTVIDYDGTVSAYEDDGTTYSTVDSKNNIYLGYVSASSGISTTFAGYAYSSGLTFSGTGSLTIDNLNYTGTELSMINDGLLTVTNLIVNNEISLGYGDGSGTLANITFTGTSSIFLDFSTLTDDLLMNSGKGSRFNLGVASYGGTITYDMGSLVDWAIDTTNWELYYIGSGTIAVEIVWQDDYTTLGTGGSVTSSDEVAVIYDGTGENANADISVISNTQLAGIVATAGINTHSNAEDGDFTIDVGYIRVSGDDTDLTFNVNVEADSVSISGGWIYVGYGLTAGTIDATGGEIYAYIGETKVTGDMTMSGSAVVSVYGTSGDENCALTVDGKLTMTGSSSIKSDSATINVADGSTLTSILGTGNLNITSGTVTAASIAETMNINLGSNTLKMTGDLSTTLLSGTGTLDMGSKTLSITGAMSSDVNVKGGTLSVTGDEISLANVAVDKIVLAAFGTLTVDSLDAQTDSAMLTIDATAIVADSSYFDASSVTLIKGTGSGSMDTTQIVLDSTTQGYIDSYGMTEGYKSSIGVVGNDLVLSFEELVEGVYTAGDSYYLGSDGVVSSIYQDASGSVDSNTAITSADVFNAATSFDLSKNQTIVVNSDTAAGDGVVKLSDVDGAGSLTLEGSSASGGSVSYAISNQEGNETSFSGLYVKDAVASIVGSTSVSSAVVTESATLSGDLTIAGKGSATLIGNTNELFVTAAGGSAISLANAGLDDASDQSVVTNSAIGGFKLTNGSFYLGQQVKTASSVAAIDAASITAVNQPLVVATASSTSGTAIKLDIDSSTYDFTSDDLNVVVFSGAAVKISGGSITINDIAASASASLDEIVGLTIYVSDNADSSFTGTLSITGTGALGNSSITWAANEDGSYTASFDSDQFVKIAQSYNGLAGMEMVTEVVLESPDGDLKNVIDSINTYRLAGQNADADKLAAAMAGASTTSIGAAAVSDISRQLGSIRNRTRSMGVNPAVVNEDMPYVNGWMAAEGSYNKLNTEGTASGYNLSSVGGSIGVEADFTEKFSMGFAYSYLLGSLTTDGPDRADGDLDTMYGSLYARVNSKRWTHSVVATFGGVNADMTRTVSTGTDPYSTKGKTSGTAAGLMYEVGYTFALDNEASACLQPVFNLSYVNSSIDGYTEKGGNGRLIVGDQKNNYLTVSAGAVLESIFGEDIYNRSSVVSARAMVKFDAGDRYAEADVKLADFNGSTQTVKGAELGSVGLELGVGVTVPVTEDTGAIFGDVSCDIRSGMTNVNGTVGYRFSF